MKLGSVQTKMLKTASENGNRLPFGKRTLSEEMALLGLYKKKLMREVGGVWFLTVAGIAQVDAES